MYILLLTIILGIGGLLAIYFEQAAVFVLALAAPAAAWAVVKRPAFAFGGCVVAGAWSVALSGGALPLAPYKLATFLVAGMGVMRIV